MFQSTYFAKALSLSLLAVMLCANVFSQTTQSPRKAPAAAAETPLLGTPVPDATVHDVEAKPIKLSQFQGKATVITFWATWCSPCIKEMPTFSKLVEQYQGKLQVLAIAMLDTREDVVHFVKKNPTHKFTWLLDPEGENENSAITQAFGVTGLPTNVFIDAEGKVMEYWRGLESAEALVKKIQGLMAK
jgi:thiol-disulfide isomerase/thioredoxin